MATFTVTADVITPEGNLEKQTITLPVMLSPVEGGYVNPDVQKELLHLEAARTRKEALEDWSRGDFAAAGGKLRGMSARIMAAPFTDANLREEVADLQMMSDRSYRERVSAKERKYMHQRAYDAHHSKREASKRVSRSKRAEEEERRAEEERRRAEEERRRAERKRGD